MTAGNLNLTTISGGATEIDLINVGLDQDYPKFSFFNTVYSRHTNFSITENFSKLKWWRIW